MLEESSSWLLPDDKHSTLYSLQSAARPNSIDVKKVKKLKLQMLENWNKRRKCWKYSISQAALETELTCQFDDLSSELGNVRHQTKSSCKDGWGSENKMKIVQTAYNYENKMKISNIKEILWQTEGQEKQ